MSSPDGISRFESLTRRAREGPNEIAHERPPRWYVQLFHAFHNPFILLLLVLAAVVPCLTEDVKAAIVIGVMVPISVLLRFVQEYRSGQAAGELQAMVGTTATVSRAGARVEVPPGTDGAVRRATARDALAAEEVPIENWCPATSSTCRPATWSRPTSACCQPRTCSSASRS